MNDFMVDTNHQFVVWIDTFGGGGGGLGEAVRFRIYSVMLLFFITAVCGSFWWNATSECPFWCATFGTVNFLTIVLISVDMRINDLD
jgi:hypothetical protein